MCKGTAIVGENNKPVLATRPGTKKGRPDFYKPGQASGTAIAVPKSYNEKRPSRLLQTGTGLFYS